MSWVKLDDRFFTNPKVMRAGRDARDLYLAGLCYCAAELTDGFIPESVIPLLYVMAGVMPLPDHNATITRLLHVALWEPAEDGYRVHDYTEYNPSAAQVKRERAANARRVQEWRGRHPEAKEQRKGKRNAITPPISNGVRNGGVTPPPYPSPTDSLSPTEKEAPGKPVRPPKAPNNVALFIDAMTAEGMTKGEEYDLSPRDTTILKGTSYPITDVAACFAAVTRQEWGDSWLKGHPSLDQVLKYVGRFKAGLPMSDHQNGAAKDATAKTQAVFRRARSGHDNTPQLPGDGRPSGLGFLETQRRLP